MTTLQRALAIAMASIALARPIPSVGAEASVEPEQWRALAVRDALASARSIDDPYRAGETFAAIARTQIAIGDDAGAEASVRSAIAKTAAIVQPEFRGWVQYEIVRAQLALNDSIGARQTSTSIVAERPQGAAYVLLARRVLQAGNVQSAESLAAAIRDTDAAGEILSEIVATKAVRRDAAGARATQRLIRDRHYAAVALAYMAIANARDGKWRAARDTVAKVPRAERGQAVGQLVDWLVERGDASSALDLAEEIDDPIRRSVIVAKLALDAHRNGRRDRSRELFSAALTLVSDSMVDGRARSHALLQIARMQTLAGLHADARESLRRVASGWASLAASDRDAVLEGAARGYLRLGDTAAALRIGLEIEDRIGRALLIRDLAASSVVNESADETLAGSWAEDPLADAAVQFGVLGAHLGTPDGSDARAIIAAARAHVARIDDPLLQPAALASLAAASVRAGDTALGRQIFGDLQMAAVKIERPDQRALAYVRAANALNDRLLFLGKPANEQDPCSTDAVDCVTR